MAKLTLTDITSGYQTAAAYNANNALIEAALENTLSRDGTTPNTMSANLDMNSNKITNVTDGTNNQDAVTLKQLNDASVVAATAAASAVTLADAGGNYASTTVEAAFAELASVSNGEGASIIGVEDSAANYTATDVEGVLAEIATSFVATDDNATLGSVFMNEKAAAEADVGGDGQLWVLNSTPNVLKFTDDAGTDFTPHMEGTALPMAEATLSDPVIQNFSMPTETGAIASGVCTIDLDDGNAVEISLTENITSFTVNNQPATGTYYEILIKFVQDATGSRTVTWGGEFASINWPGGTAPTITTTATTGTDIVSVKTFDGGTTWYGNYSQDYS